MTEQSQSGQQDVAKVYTATRRFPQLIGRTSDGARIWGGPYTYTQVFGGAAVLVVLWQSMALWSTGGALMDGAVVVCLTAGAIFGLGKLPLGGRNPLSMLHGLGNAAVAGAPREVGGLPIRQKSPRAVYSTVRILTPLSSTPSVEEERAPVKDEASTKSRQSVQAAAPDPVPSPELPHPRRKPTPAERPEPRTEPPLLVAINGEGKGRSPQPRPAAAQTSVQTLLAMAQQRKEA